MFSYYLRQSLISLKRNPILSLLMVMAIALGIAAAMTTITVNYLMSADPIPSKSDRLFYVQLDSWSADEPFLEPNQPPDQLTWRDATELMRAAKAERQSAMATSMMVIEPDVAQQKPFSASVRLAYSDFFPMFNVPFQYGQGWHSDADQSRQLVVVLSHDMNERLFGGENSVGQSLRMGGRLFQIVGVMQPWQPRPRFFDVTTGAFADMNDVYVPFLLKEALTLPNGGNNNCWKPLPDATFQAYLNSECISNQFWVELSDQQAVADYQRFLDNYVTEQKKLGRFPRPLNNHLSDVMSWMEKQQVVSDDAQIMMYMALMFLLVCLLNTVALLLAKFLGKTPEIALRRALGANRRQLMQQHVLETACIGIAGGVLGLVLTWLGLLGVERLYQGNLKDLTQLDLPLLGMGMLLALVAAILAGLYPTWRACAIAPAGQLKTQ
ncbi:ABC transporter permease [Idiomarina xiamenensis]|uniref:ABC transporter permease n=1 Tax=Idiomarina xiamenensis 10-D-4 TaxID=740709 RepID=K2KMC3_9GAMM|nr:ABC transporter permease [Idiomarina xiamenensis]EKE87672.1 hypothetical protein A10D4_01220 [Idiomarina xiamenensis 10-D-4]